VLRCRLRLPAKVIECFRSSLKASRAHLLSHRNADLLLADCLTLELDRV